jgi:hypothetical protein
MRWKRDGIIAAPDALSLAIGLFRGGTKQFKLKKLGVVRVRITGVKTTEADRGRFLIDGFVQDSPTFPRFRAQYAPGAVKDRDWFQIEKVEPTG